MKQTVVCIDAGHGGYDSGAVGPTGLREKGINLAVALVLGERLKSRGIKVVYTRTSDQVPWPAKVGPDLATRVKIAQENGADLFISIHCNAGASTGKGMEVFTSPGKTTADDLAEAVINCWPKYFNNPVIRKDLSDGDGDKEAEYYVLTRSSMTAILVELEFISNPEGEKFLASPSNQLKCAQALEEAIGSFVGVQSKNVVTMVNGNVYVPLRSLLESTGVGSITNWEQTSKTVQFTIGGKQYQARVGEDTFQKLN